jgi:hypothetical protein
VALSEELPQLRVHLNNKILEADQNCQEAKVEENDYTVLTFDDLEYELGLAEGNIRKKIAFVDNQVRYTLPGRIADMIDGFSYTYQHYAC